MATITPVALVLDTLSEDILTPTEGSTEAAVGTHNIDEVQPSDRLLITVHEDGGGAASIQFLQGVMPPAMRSPLGDSAVLTVPTNDALVIVVEASRYMQGDDTIDFTIAGNSVDVGVFRIPRSG
jgi:hypothetical protein